MRVMLVRECPCGEKLKLYNDFGYAASLSTTTPLETTTAKQWHDDPDNVSYIVYMGTHVYLQQLKIFTLAHTGNYTEGA